MPLGPVGVIFRVGEDSVINGVDFTFRRFLKWNDPLIAENPDGGRTAVPRDGAIIQAINEQTIDLLTEADLTIQGVRGDTSTYGEQTLTYAVPGMLFQTDDDGATLLPMDLDDYVQGAGEVVIDRRGWGAIEGEIEVLDTIIGEPGDYIDLEAPHQVNAKVAQSPVTQRGGTRKVQIIGRTAKPGTAVLQLEDAGNLAQTLPELPDPPEEAAIPVPTFTLAASVDFPLTIATATVTNDATLEAFGVDAVEWQYAVQETEPTVDGTHFGPLALTFGVDEIDTPAVPTGSTIWVRARSAIAATGERSAWSAWQSITLGPGEEGETGHPTLSLTYVVASDGDVTVLATTDGTSVKFAAAALATDLEATDAAVRAATADTSAPFEAVDIINLDPGESWAISAFAYDDFGNESIKVTIRARREVTSTENISWTVACSDETTPLTTGTAKVTFRVPCAVTLSEVRASVTTAPTGAAIIVDINEELTTILSTKITIDATEETSLSAAAPVISDANLADDAEITIDIDQIGSTIAGTGLKVTFIGTVPP